MKEYLPIGTIVKVNRGNEINFMIVGLMVENGEGERRDYVAVKYPMGNVGKAQYYFFNHDDISEIVHMGYVNEDHTIYVELLNSVEKQISKEA